MVKKDIENLAQRVKMAYDVGVWMGQQMRAPQEGLPRAMAISDNPGHAPDIDSFLKTLVNGPARTSAPAKKRKPTRYNLLVKKEMAKLKTSKTYKGKERFRLAITRAVRALKKEKKNGTKKKRK